MLNNQNNAVENVNASGNQTDLDVRIKELETITGELKWQAFKSKIIVLVLGVFVCGLVLVGAGTGAGEKKELIECKGLVFSNDLGQVKGYILPFSEKGNLIYFEDKNEKPIIVVGRNSGQKYGFDIYGSLYSDKFESKQIYTDNEVIINDSKPSDSTQ